MKTYFHRVYTVVCEMYTVLSGKYTVFKDGLNDRIEMSIYGS